MSEIYKNNVLSQFLYNMCVLNNIKRIKVEVVWNTCNPKPLYIDMEDIDMEDIDNNQISRAFQDWLYKNLLKTQDNLYASFYIYDFMKMEFNHKNLLRIGEGGVYFTDKLLVS